MLCCAVQASAAASGAAPVGQTQAGAGEPSAAVIKQIDVPLGVPTPDGAANGTQPVVIVLANGSTKGTSALEQHLQEQERLRNAVHSGGGAAAPARGGSAAGAGDEKLLYLCVASHMPPRLCHSICLSAGMPPCSCMPLKVLHDFPVKYGWGGRGFGQLAREATRNVMNSEMKMRPCRRDESKAESIRVMIFFVKY
jgi:hypothetical protein